MTRCVHVEAVAHNSHQIGPASKCTAHNLTSCVGNTHIVGAVAYRCSVSHSSCWSYSEVSAQEDGSRGTAA